MTFAPRENRAVAIAIVFATAGALLGFCGWYFVGGAGPRSRELIPGPPVAAQSVERPARNAADEEWVGSRVCAHCHREIWELYQSHPMAQSAASVHDAPMIEDFTRQTAFTELESRIYRVERTQEHVWHHESMTDAEGQVLYDQSVEVHYSIGSGKRGRSYLIDWGGVLTASPIAWYSGTGRWDLAPGYAPRAPQRFARRVVDGCVECHVGRLAFDPQKPNRFEKPVLLEASIGCERCHGPGREHVRWHASADSGNGNDPIVNPSRLDPAAREDVCNQCHLQGDRILRYGKSPHDFRAGQRIEDVWTVFVKGTGVDNGAATRAVSQVDQMRDSACFQKSKGRLGCVSCHEPHSVPAPAERCDYYDRRCQSCHSGEACSLPAAEREAHPAAGSCIFCHMPSLPANNVPHTAQTDHRIIRSAGASPASTAAAEGELFDHAESRLRSVDLHRARGLLQMRSLPRNLDPQHLARLHELLAPVLLEYPDDVDVLEALGTLSILQHDETQARDDWLAVLNLRPEHEGVLHKMAVFESQHGRLAPAIAYLRQYIQIDPTQIELHTFLAQLLWRDGRRDEALAAASRGVELDPRFLPLRQWLMQVCREAGKFRDAADQEQLIRRMQDR